MLGIDVLYFPWLCAYVNASYLPLYSTFLIGNYRVEIAIPGAVSGILKVGARALSPVPYPEPYYQWMLHDTCHATCHVSCSVTRACVQFNAHLAEPLDITTVSRLYGKSAAACSIQPVWPGVSTPRVPSEYTFSRGSPCLAVPTSIGSAAHGSHRSTP
jgi:hypothetical protein